MIKFAISIIIILLFYIIYNASQPLVDAEESSDHSQVERKDLVIIDNIIHQYDEKKQKYIFMGEINAPLDRIITAIAKAPNGQLYCTWYMKNTKGPTTVSRVDQPDNSAFKMIDIGTIPKPFGTPYDHIIFLDKRMMIGGYSNHIKPKKMVVQFLPDGMKELSMSYLNCDKYV